MQFVARLVCAALVVVEKWRQSCVMFRPGTRRGTQAIVGVWQHKREMATGPSYELSAARAGHCAHSHLRPPGVCRQVRPALSVHEVL